ncbi:hypothetical protein BDV30DRAFT_120050 [Aspergillus minisclerotigenes]|uniref:Uncharacterized protein n=1 Tax=Aspergillus minisclerotigenes TaxID=656917 RepID=A0A5N6J288_9EURO|nr:hypothetical protein BDV30DRAFT_120050 [Aspergillus minisclerotigenes]
MPQTCWGRDQKMQTPSLSIPRKASSPHSIIIITPPNVIIVPRSCLGLFLVIVFFRLSLPFLSITISFSILPVVYVNHVGGEVRLTRSALRYCVVPSYDRSDFVTWGSLRR